MRDPHHDPCEDPDGLIILVFIVFLALMAIGETGPARRDAPPPAVHAEARR